MMQLITMFQLGIVFLMIGCQGTFSAPKFQLSGANTKSAPDGYKFECTSVGTFPDPYVCTAYHVCYQDEATTIILNDDQVCDHGWIYDPMQKTCSIVGTSCPADPPVPTCKTENQVGALSDNPHIYYNCKFSADGKYLYPILYQCPHGGYFDGSTMACLSSTTTTSTTTTTTTPPPTTTTTSTTAQATFTCTEAGLFADPSDCHSYYSCSLLLEEVHLTCPLGHHFNTLFRRCTFGRC